MQGADKTDWRKMGEIANLSVGELLVELARRNVGAWIQREGGRWRVDVSTKKEDRRFWADTEVAALSAAIKWLDSKSEILHKRNTRGRDR